MTSIDVATVATAATAGTAARADIDVTMLRLTPENIDAWGPRRRTVGTNIRTNVASAAHGLTLSQN